MDYMLHVLREGLYLALLVALPVVAVALVVGLLMGLLQAATQIQEHTIVFVPKLVAVAVVLAALGPWIGAQMMRFLQAVLLGFPQAVQ